jgi:hypothetical protein
MIGKVARLNGAAFAAAAMALAVVCGCGSKGSPLDASGGTSTLTQTLYKNGVWGTWFGEPVTGTMSNGGYGGGFSTVSVTDTLNGDTEALAVYANGNNAFYSNSLFSIVGAAGENASAYENGHLHFDVMLGPGAYSNQVGFNGSLNVIGMTTAALSATSFSHVSLLISSANTELNGGFYPINYSSIGTAFWYRGEAPQGSTSTATQLYLDDIYWTSN